MSDEQAIRDVFTSWVEAIQTQNLEGVVANHDPSIVMFDVPPPYNGIRGIDDYREAWPTRRRNPRVRPLRRLPFPS
jgi:ketosteroid isomerase-like protein